MGEVAGGVEELAAGRVVEGVWLDTVVGCVLLCLVDVALHCLQIWDRRI